MIRNPLEHSGGDPNAPVVRVSNERREPVTTEATGAGPRDHAVVVATGEGAKGFFTRLYTGTGAIDVVGRRRTWFGIFLSLFVLSAVVMGVRGFEFGIDFTGGTKITVSSQSLAISDAVSTFQTATGKTAGKALEVGSGASRAIELQSAALDDGQIRAAKTALYEAARAAGSTGLAGPDSIDDSSISESWGGVITQRALISLAVFLALVGVFIAIRFERDMAFAALLALGSDVVLTAGVYSLIGFEVTPATVIGLLTILGFSLYDTVVVFDKVDENTHGFLHRTRTTYAEHANLAVNQTMMRSINTTVISALPIIAMFVVAVALLGVGTLKDLALVQLVGVVVGTFSSVFLATPLLVVIRQRDAGVRRHTARILAARQEAVA